MHALRRAGRSAIAISTTAAGAGQTIAAQGIIHGGLKYALTGEASAASAALSSMPAWWSACLEGRGEIDLRGTIRLSASQHLWSRNRLTSRFSAFLAGQMMRSGVERLAGHRRPAVFDHPMMRRPVYALSEPVLDVGTLLSALLEPLRGCVRRADAEGVSLEVDDRGDVAGATVSCGGARVRISARRTVLCAGAGSADLLSQMPGHQAALMQRRPLHMVMVKRGDLPALFAHCVDVSPTPLLTVTTHPTADGERVWYLGGALAEDGVAREPEAQIEAARALLAQTLPWVDLSGAGWGTFRIDRAEGGSASGRRPDGPSISRFGRVTVAWPTKLALAPVCAATIVRELEIPEPPLSQPPGSALEGLAELAVARRPWDEKDQRWSVYDRIGSISS